MKIQDLLRKIKFAVSFLLIGFLISTLTTYALTPTTTHYLTGGPYVLGSAYTIWREGSNYFAKNGFGWISYTGTNFTAVITACLGNMPTYGGIIHLLAAYYEGQIVIARSGVTIQGDGSYANRPFQFYDSPSDVLYGTVLKPTSGKDGILISGQNRSGITIRNLGIWFTTASTGDGITTDHRNYFQVEDLVIENIDVLHHDSLHSAINLENFLEVSVRNINSYGGGLLRLYANWNDFHSGDGIFENLYARVLYTLPSNPYNARGYPIIVARNGSEGNCWVNDLVCDGILVNNPTGQTDADYYGAIFWFMRASVWNHLHIEGVASTNRTVNIGGCMNVQFNTAYFWTYVDCYINSQYTNSFIKWSNCYIGGDVIDGNSTDVYDHCQIIGTIDSSSQAAFIGLENNTGLATFATGTSSLTVTARFIGPLDYVVLQLIDGDAMPAAHALRVDTINYAPTNTFVVEWDNGATLAGNFDFFWKIEHKDGWQN